MANDFELINLGGTEGSQFLAAFRRYIETPEAMLL